MKQAIHLFAGIVATALIGIFFISTIAVELAGNTDTIAALKAFIVVPGLFILVPAIAIVGASGFLTAGRRKTDLIGKKQKRMPFIAANGILILLPAALYLNHLAANGNFGTVFYLVQGAELAAGACNLVLMLMNIRDGMRMSGRLRRLTQKTA